MPPCLFVSNRARDSIADLPRIVNRKNKKIIFFFANPLAGVKSPCQRSRKERPKARAAGSRASRWKGRSISPRSRRTTPARRSSQGRMAIARARGMLKRRVNTSRAGMEIRHSRDRVSRESLGSSPYPNHFEKESVTKNS